MRSTLPALTLLGLLLAPAVPLVAAPLTPLAGGGLTATPQSQPPSGRYDFGSRAAADPAPITQTFTLQNEGKAPVTLSRIEPSCGCTTALLGEGQTLPLTLKPGGTFSVEVSLSPSRLGAGPARKTIWLYTADDADHPAALLEIVGTVTSSAPDSSPDALFPGATRPSFLPKEGHLAPPFTLSDTLGKPLTLTAARGRPLALFFFCGCPWCAEVAHLWAGAQRGSRLPPGAQTVIVFAGDKAEASAFAARTGLDLSQTRLLLDPHSKLTEGVYQAPSCPRVFALDSKGLIRYTNDHADDQPRVAPAQAIVAQALAALRKAPRSASAQ